MSGLSEQDVEQMAETAFWREQVAGHAERDRGGYFYKGFLAGFAAATERDAAVSAEAKAEHRQEWADYFAHWDGAVGTEPLTVEKVIDALRGEHLPFGTSDGGDQ